ncbi:right-handed parallel beta-helix repeat-containing protein [Thalassotalea sp. PLHSN55]|uniref:right-handed parallel beta-helix repeat-containing protein n=1 Tax=Thalassotalea sp. PLHSN55 TaxID=3435888 RepID=UPI003F846D45
MITTFLSKPIFTATKTSLALALALTSSAVFSADYYVHPTLGSDDNDGLSMNKPWKSLAKAKKQKLVAGDNLLLAQGQTFLGSLNYKKLKGTKDKPITITSYAPDNASNTKRAHINAAGQLYGIHLLDSSFVNVKNLSISANAGGIPDWVKEEVKKSQKWKGKKKFSPMRIGVYVESRGNETYSDIHLNNLLIKDVYYNKAGVSRSKKEVKSANGTQSYGWGIRFISRNKSQLANLSVTNSQITDVSHTGIKFTGKTQNVYVNKNIVFNVGGPGIQVSNMSNGLFSNNKVDSSGSNDDSRKWGRGSGMWTWSSSNILIEHNQFTNANGPGDSAGFHIDYNCDNIVVQYNLSANNAGGFCEILGNNYNNAYRYNISINDGYRVKGENNAFQEGKLFWLSGYQGDKKPRKGPFNSYFYNNTMYVSSEIVAKVAIDRMTKGALITNNIFHIMGDSKEVLGDQYNPAKKGKSKVKNMVFENNLFLKESNWPATIKVQDSAPLFGNADFVNPGGVKLADYTPQNKALVEDKGVEIKTLPKDKVGLNVGLKVTHDILGNKIIGKPDMGAIEISAQP